MVAEKALKQAGKKATARDKELKEKADRKFKDALEKVCDRVSWLARIDRLCLD